MRRAERQFSHMDDNVYNPLSWRIHCLAAKWRHDSVPRDKCDCDNEMSAVPIPSTLHSPLLHASHTSHPPPFSAGDPGEEEAEESEGPQGQGRRRRRRCRRGERRDDFLPLWRRRAQRELRQTIQVGRMKGSLSAHGDGYVAGNAHSNVWSVPSVAYSPAYGF